MMSSVDSWVLRFWWSAWLFLILRHLGVAACRIRPKVASGLFLLVGMSSLTFALVLKCTAVVLSHHGLVAACGWPSWPSGSGSNKADISWEYAIVQWLVGITRWNLILGSNAARWLSSLGLRDVLLREFRQLALLLLVRPLAISYSRRVIVLCYIGIWLKYMSLRRVVAIWVYGLYSCAIATGLRMSIIFSMFKRLIFLSTYQISRLCWRQSMTLILVLSALWMNDEVLSIHLRSIWS